MTDIIYLDCAATTPPLPAVTDRVAKVGALVYGNPSSAHEMGAKAQKILDESRRDVAAVLGCKADELVFTGGGTEADNLALFGTAYAQRKKHLVVSAIEHSAVLESAKELERRGFSLTVLPVNHNGLVSPEVLGEAVGEETFLVSIGFGNNEIGARQDLHALLAAARRSNPDVLFHTDAVQAFGNVPIDLAALGVDLLSVSAHKVHGPKGVGALFVRSGTRIQPLLYGGGQERGLRSGTENVPAVAGFAIACEGLQGAFPARERNTAHLTSHFLDLLQQEIPDIRVNSAEESRLPHILSVSLPGLKAQNLMTFLEARGIMVSAGSACHSSSTRQSHVLEAIGVPTDWATIRISISHTTQLSQVSKAAQEFVSVVKRLRKDRWKKSS